MPKENLAMANIGAARIIRDLLLEQGWTELPDVVDRVRGKVAYLVTSEGVKAAALAPDVRKAIKQSIQAGARKLYVHAVSDVMEADALDAFWVGMGFRYLMDDRDGRPIYTRGVTPPKAPAKAAKAAKANGKGAAGLPREIAWSALAVGQYVEFTPASGKAVRGRVRRLYVGHDGRPAMILGAPENRDAQGVWWESQLPSRDIPQQVGRLVLVSAHARPASWPSHRARPEKPNGAARAATWHGEHEIPVALTRSGTPVVDTHSGKHGVTASVQVRGQWVTFQPDLGVVMVTWGNDAKPKAAWPHLLRVVARTPSRSGAKANDRGAGHAYVAKEIAFHEGPKVHLERKMVEVLSGLTAYTLSPDGRVDTATAVKVSPMQYEKMHVPDLTSPRAAERVVTARLSAAIQAAELRDRVDFNAWWAKARVRLGVSSPTDSRAALAESIVWWRKASPEAAKLLRPGLLDPLLPKIGAASKPNGRPALVARVQLRDRLVARAQRRIRADRRSGRLGPVHSFSDLGRFVDGNTYVLTDAGDYDPEVDRMGPDGAMRFLGEVIERLDAWLRTGELVRESTARPKARARR